MLRRSTGLWASGRCDHRDRSARGRSRCWASTSPVSPWRSRQRPDVVLSTHIVASPAAAWIRHQLGVPFVQYVHAKEVGAKPGLARFALTRADRVVTVSRYTSRLAMAAGARPERVGADQSRRRPALRSQAAALPG